MYILIMTLVVFGAGVTSTLKEVGSLDECGRVGGVWMQGKINQFGELAHVSIDCIELG